MQKRLKTLIPIALLFGTVSVHAFDTFDMCAYTNADPDMVIRFTSQRIQGTLIRIQISQMSLSVILEVMLLL